MSSSKEEKEFAAPRKHCVQSLKTNICHFLALPPEIRAMIYVYAFSNVAPRQVPGTYRSRISTGKDSSDKTKAPAKPKLNLRPGLETLILASKFPLLLTNRFICDEATPIVYKYHTFCLEMPTKMGILWSRKSRGSHKDAKAGSVYKPLQIQDPYGRLITRLEVGNHAGSFISFWETSWGETSSGEMNSPDLPGLTASFPNLSLLRLHIRPDGARDTYHAHWTEFAADKQGIWDQLLARLDHLEFVIWHFGDKGSTFRGAIAPKNRWVQQMSVKVEPVEGHWIYLPTRRIKRSLWALQRSIPRVDSGCVATCR